MPGVRIKYRDGLIFLENVVYSLKDKIPSSEKYIASFYFIHNAELLLPGLVAQSCNSDTGGQELWDS